MLAAFCLPKLDAPPHHSPHDATPAPRSHFPRRVAGTDHDDAGRSFINIASANTVFAIIPHTNRQHVWLRRRVRVDTPSHGAHQLTAYSRAQHFRQGRQVATSSTPTRSLYILLAARAGRHVRSASAYKRQCRAAARKHVGGLPAVGERLRDDARTTCGGRGQRRQ